MRPVSLKYACLALVCDAFIDATGENDKDECCQCLYDKDGKALETAASDLFESGRRLGANRTKTLGKTNSSKYANTKSSNECCACPPNVLSVEVLYPSNNSVFRLCRPRLYAMLQRLSKRDEVDSPSSAQLIEMKLLSQDHWSVPMEYDSDFVGMRARVIVLAGMVHDSSECHQACPPFLQKGFPFMGFHSMLGSPSFVTLTKGRQEITLMPWFCARDGDMSQIQVASPEFGRTFNVAVRRPASMLENQYVNPTILFLHDSTLQREASPAQIGSFLDVLDKTQDLGYVKPLLVATVNCLDRVYQLFTPSPVSSTCDCLQGWSKWCQSSQIHKMQKERVDLIDGATGEADKYLDFLYDTLRVELIERFDLANETEIGTWGYSFAGLFSLYAAATRPLDFSFAFAGSPTIWWNCGQILKDISAVASLGKLTETKPKGLYIDVGGGEGWRMTEPLPVLLETLVGAAGFKDGQNLWLYMEPSDLHEPIAWTQRALRGLVALFGTTEMQALYPETDDSKFISKWQKRDSKDQKATNFPYYYTTTKTPDFDFLKIRHYPVHSEKQPVDRATMNQLNVKVLYPTESDMLQHCKPQVIGVQASFNTDSMDEKLPVTLTKKSKNLWEATLFYNDSFVGKMAVVTLVVAVIQSDDFCSVLCPSFRESPLPSMLGPKHYIQLGTPRTHLVIRPWFCKRKGQAQDINVNLPDPRSHPFKDIHGRQYLLPAHSSSKTVATQMIGVNVMVHHPPSKLENPSVHPMIVFAHVDAWHPEPATQPSRRILEYLDDLQSLGFMWPITLVLFERSSSAIDVMTQASIENLLGALKDGGHIDKSDDWMYLANEEIAWTRESVHSLLVLFGTNEARSLVPRKSSNPNYLYSRPADEVGSTDAWDALEDIDNAKSSQDRSPTTILHSGVLFAALVIASAIAVAFVGNSRGMGQTITQHDKTDRERTDIPSEMSSLLQPQVWPLEPQMSMPCDEEFTLPSNIPTRSMSLMLPGFLREDSRTIRGGAFHSDTCDE